MPPALRARAKKGDLRLLLGVGEVGEVEIRYARWVPPARPSRLYQKRAICDYFWVSGKSGKWRLDMYGGCRLRRPSLFRSQPAFYGSILPK